MKLKLNTGAPQAAPAAESSATAPTPTTGTPSGAPKLTFKLGKKAATQAASAAPQPSPEKPKRKYTRKPKVDENGNPIPPAQKGSKKRQREENGEQISPAAKRKSRGPKANGAALSETQGRDGAPSLVRKLTLKTGPKPSSGAPTLRVKHHGKPPERPPGVGYDSEAEDAEIDPSIESQFILRMMPGVECRTLRQAIEDRTVGKSELQGGLRVTFRFFDKEARRALVQIKNKLFAATMVDLPTVTESMKSWNKKDWVKSADICQMLLVLGPVKNEEEAKKFSLPREVDDDTHGYAHGLTPPMHWVRKRRFRPRASYRRIEETEKAVEELLKRDIQIEEDGGKIEFNVMNQDDLDKDDTSSESGSESDDEEMAEAQYEDGMPMEGEADAEGSDEDDEMAKAMEAEFLAGNHDLFGDHEPGPSSHDVAVHAIGDAGTPIPTTETPASNSNAETESADDDDDDDSDEDIDEDALAAQQQLQQQREEIVEIEKEIAAAQQQLNATGNAMLKQRIVTKIKGLENELNLKKTAMGEEVD